jgi:hypothetical protein
MHPVNRCLSKRSWCSRLAGARLHWQESHGMHEGSGAVCGEPERLSDAHHMIRLADPCRGAPPLPDRRRVDEAVSDSYCSSVAGVSGWPLETALVRREWRCPAGGGERVRLVPSWAIGLSVFGDRVSRACHRVVACSRERRPQGRGCLQRERVTPGVRRAHRRPVDARSNVEREGIPRDVGSSVGSAI